MALHRLPPLDEDPYFASEAQEVFTVGSRVFAVADTIIVKRGAEGVYLGRTHHGAFVSWDTPSGDGYRVSERFDNIRNLYR